MNKSMVAGIAIGAGALGWGMYRTNERKKCLLMALDNAKIKAAMMTATLMHSQGLLPSKFDWLQNADSLKAKIDSLILYTNRMTAEEALQIMQKNLIPAPQQENVAANLVDNLVNLFEEELNVEVPRSMEQELTTAATQAAQTPGGQAATSLLDTTDTMWHFINPQASAQPNPNLGWDEFLSNLGSSHE